MLIENIMYFALGLLMASLAALILLPAVWKRAVRLTKRRIEAATPITMAEFRADKDQLRAEFALTTRRLEISVGSLRQRLAEQLGEVNQARSDLGLMRVERDQHQLIITELEARETDLHARLGELEREGADLAQRLRMRDRELETRSAELDKLRNALRADPVAGNDAADAALSGDYDADVDQLVAALAIERQRSAFLEEQAKSLITRLENSDRRSAEASAAIAQMREALSGHAGQQAADAEDLVIAEARIASAENRLNALLAEASPAAMAPAAPLLADELSRDDAVEKLRRQVLDVESTIRSNWEGDDFDEDQLRDRLKDIAAGISRLVYAADTEGPADTLMEESLFDRVQRFADDGDTLTIPPPPTGRPGAVADRMSALQDIQGR